MRKILFTGNTTRKKLFMNQWKGREADVTPLLLTEDAESGKKDEVRMGLLLLCTPLLMSNE